jgi:hypothetical protein
VDGPTFDDLAARFRSCALPRAEWTHAAHLRVGAWHVHHLGPVAALPALRAGIRRLNAYHGTPNSATSGYHETITAAYVRLIAAFLPTFEPGVTLAARAASLVDGPLGARDVLLRFWSRDVLMSPRARHEWVPPDLAPLALPVRAVTA